VDDLAGLATRQPFTAATLAIFLLSLLGLPVTAGFLGKLYIFTAALNSNLNWLAILMAVNSVIGAYYYFRVIVVMYMHEYKGPLPTDAPTRLSATAMMVVAVTAIVTLYLGLWPNQVLELLTSQNPMLTAR
jgi:NADH-quinone oxidoreductase subunit N